MAIICNWSYLVKQYGYQDRQAGIQEHGRGEKAKNESKMDKNGYI
jgi:hypothetical protein